MSKNLETPIESNNDSNVVLTECLKTEVFVNTQNHIVILQYGPNGEENLVWFPVDAMNKIISALKDKTQDAIEFAEYDND